MRTFVLHALVISAFAVGAYAQGASPRSSWATLDGNKIHYLDVGDAKAKNALVLIHGWTCSSEFWKDSYNAFPNYRVLAIDLPGHGMSDKPKIDYTMEHFARSVNAVLENAKVKKAVLAGHSMGTPVTRQFYRLYPGKTLGIVIVDGSLRPFAAKADVDKFFAPMFANYAVEAPKFVAGMLPKDAQLAQFVKASMLATPEHVGISAMKAMLDEKIWIDDKINVPVLAVMAPSPFWPPDVESQFKAIAPNIDFQMWAGTSHFLHMERPALFNGQVKGFIMKNKLL